MSHSASWLRRGLAFLALAAITCAPVLQAGSAAAGPDTDPALEAAKAAVTAAKTALEQTKSVKDEIRADRETVRARLERHTATLAGRTHDYSEAQRALNKSRARVDDARDRLQHAHSPGEIDAARQHLREMRAQAGDRRTEMLAARRAYLAASAAVDRATAADARAQSRLAAAYAAVDAARIALDQARDYYAALLAEATKEVVVAVANIPNRTSAANFTRSMGLLTAAEPDFITLNEIGGRSLEGLAAAAPGYAVYRGGAKLTEPGAPSQSTNNAVLWDTERYDLVAQGRIQVVNDDHGYLHGKKFMWDRFATWVTLRNLVSGQLTSVVSTHMPTNPALYPRQWGDPAMTRVQLYALGMDKLVTLVNQLAAQGRVLLAGDMNSHPNQGSWTAASKMGSAGYAYSKDRGVMYLFHSLEATAPSSRQVAISSDHPALITTLDFG
jgi:hypothetical protein